MWARWTGPLAARMNSSRQNPKSNCLHLRFGGEGIVGSKEASLVAQMVKNLPAMQETRVRSPSQADPLEKGMVTHSSIPTWKIPWTEEEPGGLQSTGV